MMKLEKLHSYVIIMFYFRVGKVAVALKSQEKEEESLQGLI